MENVFVTDEICQTIIIPRNTNQYKKNENSVLRIRLPSPNTKHCFFERTKFDTEKKKERRQIGIKVFAKRVFTQNYIDKKIRYESLNL
jgi:hypothetical protein